MLKWPNTLIRHKHVCICIWVCLCVCALINCLFPSLCPHWKEKPPSTQLREKLKLRLHSKVRNNLFVIILNLQTTPIQSVCNGNVTFAATVCIYSHTVVTCWLVIMAINYLDKRDTEWWRDNYPVRHTHIPEKQLCRLQPAEPDRTASSQSGEHARRSQ